VGVLFYLKPDGQYILADDDGMAVFLFIVIMLCAMIDSEENNIHCLSERHTV
jgi:hypothetical protein